MVIVIYKNVVLEDIKITYLLESVSKEISSHHCTQHAYSNHLIYKLVEDFSQFGAKGPEGIHNTIREEMLNQLHISPKIAV